MKACVVIANIKWARMIEVFILHRSTRLIRSGFLAEERDAPSRAAATAIIRFLILVCQRDAYANLAVFDPIG